MLRKVAILLLAAAVSASAPAFDRVQKAKEVFAEYVAKGNAFDPSVADLFSDTALIQNRRTYPDGTVRDLTLAAPRYKSLIRSVMPTAQQRQDRSQYSNVAYKQEAEGVRITASRYSTLKNYTSPISLLIGPDATGSWRILEEKTASIP